MTKHWARTQQDLFEKRPGRKLGAATRAKALEQLQLLLIEAMAILGVQAEAGDDQDHSSPYFGHAAQNSDEVLFDQRRKQRPCRIRRGQHLTLR
jgi:hypothetical protein